MGGSDSSKDPDPSNSNSNSFVSGSGSGARSSKNRIRNTSTRCPFLFHQRRGAASVITAIAESEMSDSDSSGNAIYASSAGNGVKRMSDSSGDGV